MNELRKNGSPEPVFDTDDERNYLETTIRIRDGFGAKVNFIQKNQRSFEQKDYKKFKMIIDVLQEKGNISPKEAETICKKSAANIKKIYEIAC